MFFASLQINTDENKQTNRQRVDKQTESLIKARISNFESTWHHICHKLDLPLPLPKIETRRDEIREKNVIEFTKWKTNGNARHRMRLIRLHVCAPLVNLDYGSPNQNKASKKA